jgi:hypothetical protein
VYIFRWDRHGRKGQRCVVLARGTMNSCLVRFEDGYMMVTSRNALRRRHDDRASHCPFKARNKSPAIALPLRGIRWSGLASIADVQPVRAHFGVGPRTGIPVRSGRVVKCEAVD